MALSFLSPGFLWALLALPLVVVLHFLRTRRRTMVVSALFLWHQAVEEADRRRRLSPTWLLILQLLFVALAALALGRPVLSLEGPPDRVIVIDASASMAAVGTGTGSRLDQAVRIAEDLMAGAGEVALVRAGLDAVLLAPVGSGRNEHRGALSGLQAGDREASLDRALELARAVAPEAEVHVITDEPAVAGRHVSHGVGTGELNYGIVTFEALLGQAYVAVASNAPRPGQVTVVLMREGSVLARSEVLVPADGQGNVTFPIDEEAGFLEARLELPEPDALAIDDVAFAGKRELRLVVEEESGPLLRALAAVPGLRFTVSSVPAGAPVDIRVLFGEEGESAAVGPTLLFDAPAAEPEYLEVRDWAQGDELFRFVDLRETVVGLAPDRQRELPGEWEVLARAADLSPVVSRLHRAGAPVVRLHFHPSQSDVVLRPAFPALVANAIEYLRGEASVPLGTVLPEGTTFDGGPVTRALVPGIYLTPDGPVAASLLSSRETRLPAPTPPLPAAPETRVDEGRLELAGTLWLAMLALAAALLLAEWLAWSRSGRSWLRV